MHALRSPLSRPHRRVDLKTAFSHGAICEHWLPPEKKAAVCFSIDDIHPGTCNDPYECGGDLGAGALGRMCALQERHAQLKITLCVTPDWRLASLVPDTHILRHIPWLRNHVHWTRLRPAGQFRLDRHPQLVEFLKGLQRCDVIPHGLTHSHRGPYFAVEFQDQSVARCRAIVEEAVQIFAAAGLRFERGFQPPAWNAPIALLEALNTMGFKFFCSARDLETPIVANACSAMSGMQGISLLHPVRMTNLDLIHFSCNFQATSSLDRALRIVDLGGVLHIKAHIFKAGGGHVMRDGLDEAYCDFLDSLFFELQRRYGNELWWTSLAEMAARCRAVQ